MISKKGTLLLAGLAALAYYKYHKMSPEEKDKIKTSVKNTAKKVVDQLPEELKNIFSDKTSTPTRADSPTT